MSGKSINFAAKFGKQIQNRYTMERTEVAPSRLAEFKAIEEKVDAEAERRTIEELGTMGFGACHTFWKHKKKILREEYHMIWRSPQDLEPECLFD